MSLPAVSEKPDCHLQGRQYNSPSPIGGREVKITPAASKNTTAIARKIYSGASEFSVAAEDLCEVFGPAQRAWVQSNGLRNVANFPRETDYFNALAAFHRSRARAERPAASANSLGTMLTPWPPCPSPT